MISIVVLETGFNVTIHPLTTNSFTVISFPGIVLMGLTSEHDSFQVLNRANVNFPNLRN